MLWGWAPAAADRAAVNEKKPHHEFGLREVKKERKESNAVLLYVSKMGMYVRILTCTPNECKAHSPTQLTHSTHCSFLMSDRYPSIMWETFEKLGLQEKKTRFRVDCG